MTELLHKDLSEKLIGLFCQVYNTPGYGFSGKDYENAFAIELKSTNLKFITQKPIEVYTKSEKVGFYIGDVVEDKKIIESKAAENLCPEHEGQLLNYLKATDLEFGFLFNFWKNPKFKRLAFANERKNQRIPLNLHYQRSNYGRKG